MYPRPHFASMFHAAQHTVAAVQIQRCVNWTLLLHQG
jgi:hypothetical protein